MYLLLSAARGENLVLPSTAKLFKEPVVAGRGFA
jgi:hypothetical protein